MPVPGVIISSVPKPKGVVFSPQLILFLAAAAHHRLHTLHQALHHEAEPIALQAHIEQKAEGEKVGRRVSGFLANRGEIVHEIWRSPRPVEASQSNTRA